MFFGWFNAVFSIVFPLIFFGLMCLFIFTLISNTFTTYYVTFQVESGDRMEFEVDGSDYGLLVQGDIGKLSFQGTRYLGFERN